MDILYKDKTDKILKCFYNVYNVLGFGFLEKVYENALMIELKEAGFFCERQKPINVFYKETPIGEYYADIMVDSCIILELKAAECLVMEHELQLINYLRATDIELGLLLNFGKKPEFRRKIFSNERSANIR